MNFDLSTAFAVREREDGLLEKDIFDLSTAVPVDQEISMDRNARYSPPANKDRATVELIYKESGQKVPLGIKADWLLTSTPAKMITTNVLGALATGGIIPFYNMAKGVANASSPNSDIGKMIFDSAYKGLAENQDIENLGGAAAKAYPDAPWQITGSMGALAEVLMFLPGLVKGGAELLSKDKQFTIALNNARQSPKWGDLVNQVSKKAGQPPEVVDQALYNKLWSIRGETDYFKVLNGNLKKATGIDLFSETGSIPIKRAKVGQVVEFKDPQGLMKTGKISEITGERAIINLEGKDVVATLSQLSPPKDETPKLSTPTGEGQKPPVEPPKTAVSGEPDEPIKPIIKNLDISKEAKAQVESAAEQITPELEKVKGKPLTHDEVVEAAQSSDILKQVINRTQSKEVEAALLRTRQHLTALAEQKGISEDFINTLKIVKSFGTDAARKLGSLRIEAEANEFNLKTKITNKLLDNGVELDKIIKASEGLDFKNQEQVTDFYRQFVKPKLWDIISEYRYINLLSSPRTHIVNAFSNLLQVSGLASATKLVSGGLDVIHSMLKPGAARTHYMSEVPAYVKGAINSIGDAGKKALDALKGKSFVERPDVTHLPTGNKFLKTFRYIPQALEASDVFFRTIAEAGELESQLVKGIELKEAQKIAKEKASYWVFRKALDPENKTEQGKLLSEIDKLTSMVYKLRSLPIAGKAISWFLPFVQTPMNIAKQMIEYSPFGVGTIPGSKDKVEQIAKSLIGTIVTTIAGTIIANTESTWEMPTGKKEKEEFIASGRIPFAIKLGGTWYSYNRLGPIGFPIAIASASKWYLSENPSAATDTNLQKMSKVIGGLGAYFGNQSYVQGITDLMNFVKNAPGALPKLITGIPTQLITLSAFQRWVNTQIIDPVYRKTEKELSIEAIIDNARTSIIGLTKGMEAYKDINDEESRRSMPGVNAFSPVPVSNAKDESGYKEYLENRREDLIDKKESGDEPKRRTRRRR